ncbi:MAG: DUF2231 domain-containing protein [Planctomycetota bacterium]
MVVAKLHLLILHFPIAMILAAVMADALWLWLRKPIFRESGCWCIVVGAAAAIPTVITGFLFLDGMTLSGEMAELGETHETLGVITMSLALAAAAIRLAARNRLAGRWAYVYAVLVAAAAIFVGLAGHWGGMLAFGEDYLKQLL